MIAACIRIKGDAKSEAGYAALAGSALQRFDLRIIPADAITPDMVDEHMGNRSLRWTYPWDKPQRCPFTGLKLNPYRTRNPKARIGCFLSHFFLWEMCAERGETFMVFEDDAELLRALPERPPDFDGFGAISLNDPRGATRCARVYHERLQAAGQPVSAAPWVDDDRTVPQGLPGHSAYLIHPHFAGRLVEYAEMLGCWPNDALMCRQIFPEIGCLTSYLTKVSGRPSSLA